MTVRGGIFRRLGIRQRVLLVALAPMVLVGLGLVFYFTFLRYEDVEASLVSRGGAMSRQLAPASEYGLFSGNAAELTRLAQAMLAEADVTGVAFFDPDGRLLAKAGSLKSSIGPSRQQEPWSGESADGVTLFFHVRVSRNPVDYDDPFALEQTPRPAPAILGSLTLEVSRERVLASKREILVVSLGAVFLTMLVAMLLATRLGRDITSPLLRLEEAVTRLRRGQLSTRVMPHPAGTVRDLEDGFNEMASALEAANTRLNAALASSEAELQEQYEFATALLQALSDAGVGILILRQDRLVFANEAAAAIHGLVHAELLALQDWTELLPEERRDEIRQRADLVRHATRVGDRFESVVRLPEGPLRFLDVVMTRLEGERDPRVVMVESDITERRLAEENLSLANQELQSQRDDAQRANQAKSRFLAAASHDLRQPIHALTLFVGELRRQANSASLRRLSKQIHSAVQLLVELLDTLLEISRIDIQDMKPRLRPLALDGWLESIAIGHAAAAKEKGLTLRVAPSSLCVLTDPVLLARIVGNLLSNAVRYTPSGHILLGVRRQQESVRIEVWDSGVGVEEEHLPHLFQEFYQVENPERDAAKGLGLGLSIVDRLAAVLGYPLSVRSWPGRGSVFTVTLPLASAESLAAADPPGDEGGIPADNIVLLKMGNRESADRLGATMAAWGYRVLAPASTDSLQSAVEALPGVLICEDSELPELDAALPREGEGRFDLIILGEETRTLRHSGLRRTEYLTNPPRPARLRALLQHLTSGERSGDN